MGNYLSEMDYDSQDNALATATLAATDGKRYGGEMLWVGYSAAPAAGSKVTLKKGATTVLVLPISEAGPIAIPLAGVVTAADQALSAELDASGTGGIVGYVGLSAAVL